MFNKNASEISKSKQEKKITQNQLMLRLKLGFHQNQHKQ